MDDSALTEPNETRLEGNEPTALSGNNKVDFTDITEDDSQERKEKKSLRNYSKKSQKDFLSYFVPVVSPVLLPTSPPVRLLL